MKYIEVIESLEKLPRFPRSKKVEHLKVIKQILKSLDNPEQKLKFIHVTGTNGKGSTCATLASILRTAGYRTGLFTSPHLLKYNERIQINNESISDRDFVTYFQKTQPKIKEFAPFELPPFSYLTLLALLYFAEKKVDIAVLEVGIGGRYDSTNVIKSLVSIITNIDLEHTEVLGNSKEAIAREKAGIITKNSVVITAEKNRKAQQVIRRITRKQNAEFIFAELRDIRIHAHTIEGQVFDFEKYQKLKTPLLGNYQTHNIALAILCSEILKSRYGFHISGTAIRQGIAETNWPLRLEIIPTRPAVLVDAGHNVAGIKNICTAILEIFPQKRKVLILGCSYDKPYLQMAKLLSRLSDTIILTAADYHAISPEKLLPAIKNPSKKNIYTTSNVREAIALASDITPPDGLIMVLGGLYLASEAKGYILERHSKTISLPAPNSPSWKSRRG